MSGASDYLEGALIDHLFRTTDYTSPTVLAIALATATIVDADTGATITEVSGNAYARAEDGVNGNAINPLDANWTDPAADGITDNVTAITFPTATGSWGTVTDFGIMDSATEGAGNLLLYAALTASKAITTDDQPKFAIGALTVTCA